MNPANIELAKGLVDAKYLDLGSEATKRRENLVRVLLTQRRVPDEGYDDVMIMALLSDLALLDSNNFVGNVGGGEREARVICPLVSLRHYGLAHGIGRSGDVGAVQPKAAGSSIIVKVRTGVARG